MTPCSSRACCGRVRIELFLASSALRHQREASFAMKTPPSEDRFDHVPPDLARVGAHRAPRSARNGLIGFAWSALATFVIVCVAMLTLVFVTGTITLSGLFPVATPTPSVTIAKNVKATIDPSVLVNVTNAADVVEKTMVYFGDPAVEGAAKGVARALGAGAETERTSAYAGAAAKITVVVGSSYFRTAEPVPTATPTPTAN
jgi:hypothetical protein